MDRTRTDTSRLRWFVTNPRTGKVAVAQRPNVPLLVFLVATAVRILLHPHGTVGDVVSLVGTVALAVWAILEVVRGDSPFRRVLGGVVLALLLARVVL